MTMFKKKSLNAAQNFLLKWMMTFSHKYEMQDKWPLNTESKESQRWQQAWSARPTSWRELTPKVCTLKYTASWFNINIYMWKSRQVWNSVFIYFVDEVCIFLEHKTGLQKNLKSGPLLNSAVPSPGIKPSTHGTQD